MCNNHDHYITYSNDEYSYLCFRHATLEAINGKTVSTEVQLDCPKTDCDICDQEYLDLKNYTQEGE